MSEFLRPSKKSLKNAQHFSLIEAFITVMVQQGFSAAKIVALLAELQAAFGEEDRWYMISRKSELVAQRDEADRRRDNYYARLHAIIRAWAGSGMALLDEAATMLKRAFDLYKVKTSAQVEEETGQLDNLITDISTTEMQAALETLNGTWLFQQMREANEQVKALRLEEGQEMSEKVKGALVSARKESDRIYDELTYLIEAFEKTADDATPYTAFIRKWNGTLKIYQDMLDRKSASGKDEEGGSGGSGSGSQGGSQQGGSGSGSQQGGSSSEGGSGEGGGSGDSGGTGENEEPGGSGDNGGSGSEGGGLSGSTGSITPGGGSGDSGGAGDSGGTGDSGGSGGDNGGGNDNSDGDAN